MKNKVSCFFIFFSFLFASTESDTLRISDYTDCSEISKTNPEIEFNSLCSVDDIIKKLKEFQFVYFIIRNDKYNDVKVKEILEKKEKDLSKSSWNEFQHRMKESPISSIAADRSILYKSLNLLYVRENSVTKIILRSCEIDDGKLEDVLYAMTALKKIEVFDVEDNLLTVFSIEKLMSFVRFHPSLLFINVRKNQFAEEECFEFLRTHLKESSSQARRLLNTFIIATQISEKMKPYLVESWVEKHKEFDKLFVHRKTSLHP